MKHEQSFIQTSGQLAQWLQPFSKEDMILKMATLLNNDAFIIVGKTQNVLHWSKGAEQLLGIRREKMVGRICPEQYRVPESQQAAEDRLNIQRADDGAQLEVEKFTEALFDKDGSFVGGMVMLKPLSESTGIIKLPTAKPNKKQQDFHGIISRSPAMQPVFQIIQNAAKTEATVLVRGESGSGKELVARAIHDLSSRHNAPFLAINCAALSVSLLESELFGHVKGAFTGAVKEHIGLFQRANGGTMFLDEVAELPQELQAKLLRVIQERNFIPVGGSRTVEVDVRIVAATHRSLREEVKNGRFREDLMYRLRVVPIFIPALRERREDISLLLWHFIDRHNEAGFRRIEKIDPQAMRVLLDYRWPGNIRELQNVVEYAFAVGRGSVLRISELPPEFREPVFVTEQSQSDVSMSEEEEAQSICQALEQCDGKITDAARSLGMSRATFWRKRKRYGV